MGDEPGCSSGAPQNLPQTNPKPTLEGDLKLLYEAVKPVVWKVHIKGVLSNGERHDGTLTAFVVKDNLLMSCAHGGWTNWGRLEIKAKPLTGNVTYTANVVDRKVNCDMVLLRVENAGRMQAGKFGDGKLEVGEGIMVFGHPHDLIASGCSGRNFYPCVAAPTNFDINTTTLACLNYKIDVLSNPPRHRVMGDVWNEGVFTNELTKKPDDRRDLKFEKNLLARLPIIQAAGMICGPGSSGAPVFNFKREIVGMHVYGLNGYEIGIHVTALNMFLQNYLAKQSGGSGSGGAEEVPPIKGKGKGKAKDNPKKQRRQ